MTGSPGADRMTVRTALGNEVRAGGGNDRVVGGAGPDRIYGETGGDALSGRAGDDMLDGGSGDDTLIGESGADTAVGGFGHDTLDGGLEHKHLYRRIKDEVPDERYTIPFGEARIHREGDDVTLVTWGAMVYTADEAAKQLEGELSVEIIDLRTIAPWDRETVLESVAKTSKALVLHEDTQTAGFGAEIMATIMEEAFEDLDAPVKRVTAPDTPVPFAPPLEKWFLPQVEDVVAGLEGPSRVLGEDHWLRKPPSMS